MKRVLISLVLAMLLVAPLISAEEVPIVKWKSKEPIRPLAISGGPGDKIKMKGQLCVDSASPVGYTGRLRFQIWGVGTEPCRVVCGWDGAPCYDYEACGAQRCTEGDVVCIQGAWPGGNRVCDAYPCDESCGADCDEKKIDVYSAEYTLDPGECVTVEFTPVTIGDDWEAGHYVAVLQTVQDGRRVLDVEYAEFTVGIPRVDVQILSFAIVAVTASILGLAIWRLKP